MRSAWEWTVRFEREWWWMRRRKLLKNWKRLRWASINNCSIYGSLFNAILMYISLHNIFTGRIGRPREDYRWDTTSSFFFLRVSNFLDFENPKYCRTNSRTFEWRWNRWKIKWGRFTIFLPLFPPSTPACCECATSKSSLWKSRRIHGKRTIVSTLHFILFYINLTF